MAQGTWKASISMFQAKVRLVKVNLSQMMRVWQYS